MCGRGLSPLPPTSPPARIPHTVKEDRMGSPKWGPAGDRAGHLLSNPAGPSPLSCVSGTGCHPGEKGPWQVGKGQCHGQSSEVPAEVCGPSLVGRAPGRPAGASVSALGGSLGALQGATAAPEQLWGVGSW